MPTSGYESRKWGTPYTELFKVLERNEKYFTIELDPGNQQNVSLDRLKTVTQSRLPLTYPKPKQTPTIDNATPTDELSASDEDSLNSQQSRTQLPARTTCFRRYFIWKIEPKLFHINKYICRAMLLSRDVVRKLNLKINK